VRPAGLPVLDHGRGEPRVRRLQRPSRIEGFLDAQIVNTSGPPSQSETRMLVPRQPAVTTVVARAICIESARSSMPSGSCRNNPGHLGPDRQRAYLLGRGLHHDTRDHAMRSTTGRPWRLAAHARRARRRVHLLAVRDRAAVRRFRAPIGRTRTARLHDGLARRESAVLRAASRPCRTDPPGT
jgi:hypothetical protein